MITSRNLLVLALALNAAPTWAAIKRSCGNIPLSVIQALHESVAFINSCKIVAKSAATRPIAINDYSQPGPPTMYIFDADNRCIMRTSAAYGGGMSAADKSKPSPCADNGSHLTPPGFHLTASNGKYKGYDSLLLIGAEGQRSARREILIHRKDNCGVGSTWGCTGVNADQIENVVHTLGAGALVYNYFGQSPLASDCTSRAGYTGDGSAHKCDPDQIVNGGLSPDERDQVPHRADTTDADTDQ